MAELRQQMQFFHSRNDEVKKHVSRKTGKIAPGGNFKAFNENWVACNDSAETIAQKIVQGSGLCAWHLLNGRRSKSGTECVKAGLIIIDIDNQLDGKDENGNKVQKQELTEAESLELDLVKKYCSFAYRSPSHTESWPRFRLVFGLEVPVIDTDFYQWFTRYLSQQIPGSDLRATTVPNLFYGAKGDEPEKDLFYLSENYIPSKKITEAYQHYLSLPKESVTRGSASDYLSATVKEEGVDLEKLLSNSVKAILEGNPVEDRSFAMAMAFKEIIGWCNWLNAEGISIKQDPLTTAQLVFENIYEYSPELDGKFDRILSSVSDSSDLKPALLIASEDGELSVWKKIKYLDRETFTQKCPDQIKTKITEQKPKPVSSILTLEYEQKTDSKSTSSTKTVSDTTPKSPAQLIKLQQDSKQFSENDVADIIVNNYGEEFLFDSSLDEFFTYDKEEGIWYIQDEQHIKRRIVKTLDTFITAGVLQRYNSATVSSVFQILKAKLLKSVNGGRTSIWSKNRSCIPFTNGVLQSDNLGFLPGNDKNLYLRTKLSFPYDPKAKCPNFIAWLESCVGKDKVIIIQAFCRALLTGYTTGERFLHLVGPGGTGKSTLQQVLIALAGFSGTHTSNLEIIETNKFECHNLIGKRLLLLTDEANFNKRLDVLKKITSASDTLRAERKYGKEVINFKPEVLVCIASNEHISSSDISSGLERRRLTVIMDKVVPASKRRDLLNVYADHVDGELAPELSGVVSWALSMSFEDMRDVLANPVKHVPTLNATNLEALIFNNPYVAWVSECTMYSPNSSSIIGMGAFRPSTDESERGLFVKNAYTELYASYVNFCKSNGYKHSAKPRFVDRLKETIKNVLKVTGVEPRFIDGKAVFTGLRLKPFDPSTDRACSGANRLPSPVEWASNPTDHKWQTAFQEHDQKTD
jgi:phage/plasmid-associated DNA primase